MGDLTRGETDRVDVGTAADVPAHEKVRALEAVLRSETFARSERLRDFLSFICEAEIQGRLDALNEHTIGVEALGRPENFSPSDDSSVRSRFYELRLKLNKFYDHEAQGATMRIELPKGSYLPRFVKVVDSGIAKKTQAAPLEIAEPAFAAKTWLADAPPVWKQHFRLAGLAFLGGIVLTLLALAGWVHFQSGRATGKAELWTPELEAIWKPFLLKDVPAIIVFESPLFLRSGHLVVRDPDVNTIRGVSDSAFLMSLKQLFHLEELKESRNYTDAGVAQAMFYLTRLLSSRIPNLTVKNALQLSAEDYKRNNLILLGRPWTNPRIHRQLADSEFIDEKSRVRNLRPRSGEQAYYEDEVEPPDSDRWGRKYAVISSLASEPEGRHVLCLLGRGSEHASALAYYMTAPETAKDLYKRMQLEAKIVPEYFQVVVKAEFDRQAPVKVQSVAFRVLTRQK